MGLRKIREIFWYNFYVKIIPERQKNIENTDFCEQSRLVKPMRFEQRGFVDQSD